jgi:hypothetical protein
MKIIWDDSSGRQKYCNLGYSVLLPLLLCCYSFQHIRQHELIFKPPKDRTIPDLSPVPWRFAGDKILLPFGNLQIVFQPDDSPGKWSQNVPITKQWPISQGKHNLQPRSHHRCGYELRYIGRREVSSVMTRIHELALLVTNGSSHDKRDVSCRLKEQSHLPFAPECIVNKTAIVAQNT